MHRWLSISTLGYIVRAMKRPSSLDVRLLQAAAAPPRLAILRQLTAEGEVCACDFTSCCDVAQPTVSHHLKVLREAGWIDSERRGTWIWYSIRPQALERFKAIATEIVATPGRPLPAGGRLSARTLPVIQP